MSPVTASIQHYSGGWIQCIKARERNRKRTNWNGRIITVFTYRQDDLLCTKPDGIHQKLLELINQLSKHAGHKIIIQKSALLLHTTNEQSEDEILK